MKLKDFLTLKVGAGVLLSGTRYSPYINYSWSTKTVGTSRKLTDLGTAKLDADMYTGRAKYFDSALAQTSILNINATIQTIYYFNGTNHVYAEGSQTLTTYTLNGSKQYSNLIFYNGIFTASQKLALENTSEEFLYYDEARNKYSNVLNASELSKVVAHFPMTDTDEFIRDNAGYSLLPITTSISVFSQNKVIANGDGSFTLTVVDDVKGCAFIVSTVAVGKNIGVTYDIISSTATKGEIVSWFGVSKRESIKSFSHINTSTRTNGDTQFDGLNVGAVITFKVILKEISGIYPITNYTQSMNKTALNTGLQTGKLKLDNSGLIIGKSDYLEFYGKGYVDTKLSFNKDEKTSLEYILKVNKTISENRRFGNVADGFALGIASPNIIYVRYSDVTYGYTNAPVSASDYYYIVFSYGIDENILYINGIPYLRSTAISSTPGTKNTSKFELGRGSASEYTTSPLRMWKVYRNKALTQAEVTKNYNDAVAKGLLL